MASAHPDANPLAGGRKGGSMKNVDGREGGAGWNSDASKGNFSDKSVGATPNEGAPELKKKGVVGKVI